MSCVTPLSEAKRKLIETYRRGRNASEAAPANFIAPRPAGTPVPLSLSQEQLVLREVNTAGISLLYNECVALRMTGPLNVAALEKSLLAIIERHEIWRTSYDVHNGQALQVIHPAPEEIALQLIDLHSVPAPHREVAAQQVIEELVRQPFDLQNGPLLRFRLVKLGDFEHRLFLVAHLSIVDGVSAYQIWPSELAALYSAYSEGRPSPLPGLPIQFGDYAHWQRSKFPEEEMGKQQAYWRRQLAGTLPVLSWPKNRPQTPAAPFPGAICPFVLSAAASEAVKELSKQEAVTLFVSLLAAFVTLLFAYTEQEDIVIGTPSSAGRKRPEVARLLGYFLNPVALRFDLSNKPTFRDLLRQAQRSTLEAIANDDVPIEWLARELQAKSNARQNPFFSVAMSLQPAMPSGGLDWSVTSMDVESGGSPWDLYVAFIDRPTRMLARVQYNPDVFEKNTIIQMWQDFERLLGILSADPQKRLADARALSGDKAKAI